MADEPLARNARLPQEADPGELPDDVIGSIIAAADDPALAPRIDPKTGALSIDTEDGGVVVQFNPRSAEPEPSDEKHFDNLADRLPDQVRMEVVEEVMRGIEADDESRQGWLDMRAEGIKMLGTALEKPRGDAGNATEPFEGMSTVRHPLLLEATARVQANAAAELYPPSGPVKVRDDRPSKPAGAVDTPLPVDPLLAEIGADQTNQAAVEQTSREDLAEALEKGFNHNLTVGDRGYRPDKVRMLFTVAFGGCAFVKVYDCPIRERPMSRYVDAKDVIVANGVSDERDAGRITHRIPMRKSVVKRMQIAGVYRKVDLHEPQQQPDPVEEAINQAQGLADTPQRQEDQQHTIYESYVELDIPGFEHKRRGEPTGLSLPYKVSIDKDSREMLELRRNWEPDDDTMQPRRVFVKYGFIPALGFYDLGLLHLLGNGDKALTAAWREALDAGMFGNFPGFIYNEGVIRNWTNQNRVPPGGGIGIKGVGNLPLDQVIKPLPYKDVGAGFVNFIQHVEQRMDRVAGTAELQVGEGRQDAPVGTTLALIEQATKILSAVHIGWHASQAEEFQLLKERYRQNPEAFWRWNKKGYQWEESLFLRALEDHEIVPAADPNTPSHLVRVMRAQAKLLLAQQAPFLFNLRKTARQFLTSLGNSDPDEILLPEDQIQLPGQQQPQQPPPDPSKMAAVEQKAQQSQQEAQARMAELQQKGAQAAQDHQAKMAEAAMSAQADEHDRQLAAQAQVTESADRAADRHSREVVAGLRLQTEREKLEHEGQQANLDRAGAAMQQGLAAPPQSLP